MRTKQDDKEIEALRKELENANRKTEEYLNGWKRAKADYLNLKKETKKEKEEIIRFANTALILKLIPIHNHLKKAFKHLPKDLKDNEWVKGIEQIKKQLKDLLEAMGISEIETKEVEFNPELHEAVSKQKKEGVPSGMILEEIAPGYRMHDKVIVHAKVKVAE